MGKGQGIGIVTQNAQTITAPTLDKCRSKLDTLYGDQYRIINTRRTLSGGFLGFGQKEYIECKYVIKDSISPDRNRAIVDDADSDDMPLPQRRMPINRVPLRTKMEEYSTFQKNQAEILRMATTSAKMASVSMDSKFEDKLNAISNQLQTITAGGVGAVHPTIKKIEDLLSDNEFNLQYIRDVAERIRNTFSLGELDDYGKVEKRVVEWIGQSIEIAGEDKKSGKLPKTVVIVGPTGVGKTTSLMKLASKLVVQARNSGNADPRIQFVTIDSMRVGAFEQIARFGDVFNTTALRAESLKELQEVYENAKDKIDALFIDTSGYSPNDADRIGKMKSILQIEGFDPEVYLAIAASTKARDIENIMENYALFHYESIIVTKMDESMQFGNIISVCSQKKKSISYVADGQNIAKGMHRATVEEFLKHLSGFKVEDKE